jgi:hypothetical protein
LSIFENSEHIQHRRSQSVGLTNHAIQRCIERGVSARKVLQCLKRRRVYFRGRTDGFSGQLISYQLEFPGKSEDGNFLRVICVRSSILTAFWSTKSAECEKEKYRRLHERKRIAAQKSLLTDPHSLTKVKPKAPQRWDCPASPPPPSPLPLRRCRLEIKNYATASTASWSIITLDVGPAQTQAPLQRCRYGQTSRETLKGQGRRGDLSSAASSSFQIFMDK